MASASSPQIHRTGLFALGMLLLLGVAAPFVTVIVFPAAACDAFGPLMACPDGSRPKCESIDAPGARRHEKELSITCRGKPRSGAPMWLACLAAAMLAGVPALALVALSLRAPRP